ncbi:hypothetical protein BC830DRAFT_288219 [Chytriomyces sp. MP71]|nr:hypothetical protein BC830DRAFT_288219 [Chytriomyces sp. MP71]
MQVEWAQAVRQLRQELDGGDEQRHELRMILRLLEQARLRQRSHDAVACKKLAKASLVRSTDLLQSIPFHQVSRSLRCAHELSSLLFASCLDVHSNMAEEALKILDTTLLVSGAPSLNHHVHAMIHALVERIRLPSPPAGPALPLHRTIPPPKVLHPVHAYHAREPPALHPFQRNHLLPSRPCILRGACAHWPALSGPRAWSVEALRERCGARWVPVEVGGNYVEEGWGQRVMRFVDFVDGYVLGDGSRSTGVGAADSDDALSSDSQEGSEEESSNEDGASCKDRKRYNQAELPGLHHKKRRRDDEENTPVVGYLAQHNLFTQIPDLERDIMIPDYCHLSHRANDKGLNLDDSDSDYDLEDTIVKISSWFGPAGTVSPLHTDPQMNLFAQVMGRKYVRLYSPSETHKLYPHAEGMMTNTSQVDVECPDLNLFPNFQAGVFQDCIVEPGDLLFIPVCA